MEAKLYVILGSHACRAGMLLLEHKGIPYRRVELPTGLHPAALRVLGYAGKRSTFRRIDERSHLLLAAADRMGTVPTLRVDGDRWVATNRAIARFLDDLQPDPPLFPADEKRRNPVEEAERWGDEVFQMAARRLVLGASLHGIDSLVNRANDGRLGPLLFRHATTRLIGARMFALSTFAVTQSAEQKLVAELPDMLDRIDAWIAAGVLNGEHLYAADFMIAPSLALLTYRPELRAEVERRPLIGLIDRVLPEP
jgi:glutathione S-transferase